MKIVVLGATGGVGKLLVGPGRLTDGPRTGVYRTGETIPKGGSKISRADVADLLFKEVVDT